MRMNVIFKGCDICFYIDVVDVYISSTFKIMNSSCLPAVKIQIFTDAYVALEAFACPPQP